MAISCEGQRAPTGIHKRPPHPGIIDSQVRLDEVGSEAVVNWGGIPISLPSPHPVLSPRKSPPPSSSTLSG